MYNDVISWTVSDYSNCIIHITSLYTYNVEYGYQREIHGQYIYDFIQILVSNNILINNNKFWTTCLRK